MQHRVDRRRRFDASRPCGLCRAQSAGRRRGYHARTRKQKGIVLDTITIIGFAAGFLTTIAFIPQVLKIWKTRSAKDVSLPAFATFTVGIAGWIAFGILKQDPPIILWNVVTFVLAAAILAMKVRFG